MIAATLFGCTKTHGGNVDNKTEPKPAPEAKEDQNQCNLVINYTINNDSTSTDNRAIVIHFNKDSEIKSDRCDFSIIQLPNDQYASFSINNNQSQVANGEDNVSLSWQTWSFQTLNSNNNSTYQWSPKLDDLNTKTITMLKNEFQSIFKDENDDSFTSFKAGRRIISIFNNRIFYYDLNQFIDEDNSEDDDDDDVYYVPQQPEVFKACHNKFGSLTLSPQSTTDLNTIEASIDSNLQELGIAIPDALLNTYKKNITSNLQDGLKDNDIKQALEKLDVSIIPTYQDNAYAQLFSYGNDKFYSLNDLSEEAAVANTAGFFEENPPCFVNNWNTLTLDKSYIDQFESLVNANNSCGKIDLKNNQINIYNNHYSITELLKDSKLDKVNYTITGAFWITENISFDTCKNQ